MFLSCCTVHILVLVFFLLFDFLPAHLRFYGTGKLNDRDGLASEVKKDDVRLTHRELSLWSRSEIIRRAALCRSMCHRQGLGRAVWQQVDQRVRMDLTRTAQRVWCRWLEDSSPISDRVQNISLAYHDDPSVFDFKPADFIKPYVRSILRCLKNTTLWLYTCALQTEVAPRPPWYRYWYLEPPVFCASKAADAGKLFLSCLGTLKDSLGGWLVLPKNTWRNLVL